MRVDLDKLEIKQCRDFAEKFICAGKSASDFGNSQMQRGVADKIADAFSGKIGECGFALMCRKKGINIGIDYSIEYGHLNNDNGQDITTINGTTPPLKYDIKTTKLFARWFLIESHKADSTIIKSDVYILIKANLPSKIEDNIDNIPTHSVYCELAGFIKHSDLFDQDGKPWFLYPQRSRLCRPEYVQFCWQMAEQQHGPLTHRGQLSEFQDQYAGELFMGYPLKAPFNFGMPIERIRKGTELFKLLLPREPKQLNLWDIT